jgi:hypothetical protein
MTGINVKDYFMFFNNDSNLVHKRNKKKLSKKQILKKSNFEFVKYNEVDNLLNSLYSALQLAKTRRVLMCGVIFDTNVIIHDITYIPTTPSNYDILCLESEIISYKSSNESLLYWSKVNIKRCGNFIINGYSIDKVLHIISASKDMNEFFDKLNNLMIFTITQHHFSEHIDNYVHDPLIINKKLTEEEIITYDSKLANEFYEKFNKLNLIGTVDLEKRVIKEELLPSISLICPFSDKNQCFHAVLSFLKLDYPRELLELVIIDDTNSEKELHLPQDKRIKLLNINNTKAPGSPLPLGYKLNVGVKHASHNIILHWFDTNNYCVNMRKLISHLVISNKSCIMSIDTCIYNKNKHFKVKIPDISNCLYTKDFWRLCSFEDVSHNLTIPSDLVYKWIFYRYKEISFIPFVYMSFKLPLNMKENIKTEECEFDLSNLVDKKIKESFELLLLD